MAKGIFQAEAKLSSKKNQACMQPKLFLTYIASDSQFCKIYLLNSVATF